MSLSLICRSAIQVSCLLMLCCVVYADFDAQVQYVAHGYFHIHIYVCCLCVCGHGFGLRQAPLTMLVLVHVFGFAAEGVSALTSAMPQSADATKHSLSLVCTRVCVCVCCVVHCRGVDVQQ
jgi:hypothetical protein